MKELFILYYSYYFMKRKYERINWKKSNILKDHSLERVKVTPHNYSDKKRSVQYLNYTSSVQRQKGVNSLLKYMS